MWFSFMLRWSFTGIYCYFSFYLFFSECFLLLFIVRMLFSALIWFFMRRRFHKSGRRFYYCGWHPYWEVQYWQMRRFFLQKQWSVCTILFLVSHNWFKIKVNARHILPHLCRSVMSSSQPRWWTIILYVLEFKFCWYILKR